MVIEIFVELGNSWDGLEVLDVGEVEFEGLGGEKEEEEKEEGGGGWGHLDWLINVKI